MSSFLKVHWIVFGKLYISPENCLWHYCCLSSSKELSLSYFVLKAQSLIFGNREATLSRKALTQTHIQNIVGWLELVVIFYPAQHFHHCIYFILIIVSDTVSTYPPCHIHHGHLCVTSQFIFYREALCILSAFDHASHSLPIPSHIMILILISPGSASNSNLSFLMSIKIKNPCLCTLPSKAANTFTFHPPKGNWLWLLRTFSRVIRHYLSFSLHNNLLFVAQLLVGFFSLMVTCAWQSVYLFSLSHLSWSLMLDTVSTYSPCHIHHGHSC